MSEENWVIDLRSDTLTQPTREMKEAMMMASLGDDVFGEDPTVRQLEAKLAGIFGMEAGLFCPSGTMTNQIAIRLHTQPQTEVVCHKQSHIYLYEGGGIMSNSHASVRLLDGELGKIDAESIRHVINPDDDHAPETALVSLENTMNKGGGSVYHLAEVRPIRQLCKETGLKLHLDGARLFNALIHSGDRAYEWGRMFDTISICLSKGLGCPVGSVLLGKQSDIKKARKIRKAMGGGMRQAGMLAAAGIYALDHHVSRLEDDHIRARIIGEIMQKLPHVREILPVSTNILIARLDKISPESFLEQLAEKNIRAVKFGNDQIRMVTHLDIEDRHLEALEARLANWKSTL
ncbi:L-threonine aldolase [Cyclobacterium lianum]|uniref:L-threonine aldolase n=1 Tax=Cyclobacterium lianum TaxID=388280 RepID=A0A1M7PF84_9BACT|nr:GntG family PLP-dependent aldolase [Cyclobacterium lianum]SHN15303.1 L-threonine aldolase [Cyclobacterium lianum]